MQSGTLPSDLCRTLELPGNEIKWELERGEKEMMQIPCPQFFVTIFGGKSGIQLTDLGHNQRVFLFAWEEGCI